ncbi:hypothetical protein HPB48_009643 [Haemaphysalis longicornis]|uniref:Uncharacterized protein n=1 Tax=Haemaphysalis longicornis TaxID=44386 RepID=A0A9J6FQJ0_HAELO|nr:hypothetical protein HPB48_009643 [Haemaphysalis longicornis]
MHCAIKFEEKLGVPKTSKLLRAWIDQNGTRTASQVLLNKLIHLTEWSDKEFIKRLADKYLSTDPPEDQPEHKGEPNEDLDRPVTTEELIAQLTLIKMAALDRTRLQHEKLFNLDDDTIAHLVEPFILQYWDRGFIPPKWNKVEMRFLPKPNKD